jgi:hypothetical protein
MMATDPAHYKQVVTSSVNRGPRQRAQDQKRLDILPDRFHFVDVPGLWRVSRDTARIFLDFLRSARLVKNVSRGIWRVTRRTA